MDAPLYVLLHQSIDTKEVLFSWKSPHTPEITHTWQLRLGETKVVGERVGEKTENREEGDGGEMWDKQEKTVGDFSYIWIGRENLSRDVRAKKCLAVEVTDSCDNNH